jgi:hypothetical protein
VNSLHPAVVLRLLLLPLLLLLLLLQVYSKAAGVAYVSVSHKGGQSGRVRVQASSLGVVLLHPSAHALVRLHSKGCSSGKWQYSRTIASQFHCRVLFAVLLLLLSKGSTPTS